MALSNHLECHPVVGCLSNKSSSEMLVRSPHSPVSCHHTTVDVRAIIPTIFNALIAAYKRYQGRVALHRLNEHQLRDIGLERTRDGYATRDWY